MWDDGIPVIECVAFEYEGVRCVEFWCQHCKCKHSHGFPHDNEEVGHRVAHCHSKAGRDAYPRGYDLKLVGGARLRNYNKR
jgi:hypothetical protein